MNIKETLEDIKETVCNSRLYVSPFELDNYMCSLGAVSYFEDNSEKDFLKKMGYFAGIFLSLKNG